MTNTITLPDQYHLLAWICTATKWKRAACVYAFTGPFGIMSAEEFAAIGIVGLSSTQFVEKYRTKWQELVDRSIVPAVCIGDTVKLPAQPFGRTGNPHRADCNCGCWDGLG